MAAEDNASIERAMKNLAAAVPRVERDPSRPRYHLQPPALWNNDPNGLIFHKGYYHVFYQFNPYGDVWGNIHWGHARSTDLTHWEHLPIALWPSREQGEEHCFSGCTVIDDQGRPMVFYTSVGPQKHPRDSADQWAAIGDNDLIRWTKHPANPILTQALHGGLKILEWRDPFVFREEGRWLMVLGGHRAQGSGCICLYESPDLLDWRFLGIPIEGTEPNWECPSLFRLRDKWILIYSPHGPVRYYTGQLDLTRCRFTPDFHGTLDHSEQFYAATHPVGLGAGLSGRPGLERLPQPAAPVGPRTKRQAPTTPRPGTRNAEMYARSTRPVPA
jgi:beta-fructofuranosidase